MVWLRCQTSLFSRHSIRIFTLHLTCIIHQWGKENFYRYSKSSLSLFTQRHFSGYVVTRGLRVGWEVMYCRVPRTCTFWNAFPTRL